MIWITSYASIYNTPGAPLFDLMDKGRRGDDPRMFFSWYSADYCTDPSVADLTPEEKANPSRASWNNPGYLAQQRRRLPSHKFRRLHLNLPGMPDGAYPDATQVMNCIVEGRKSLPPVEGVEYCAFVDMSGGSSDDAALGISHYDKNRARAVMDCLIAQTGKPPFNPREAVTKFAGTIKRYRLSSVTGDRYGGQTFVQDFSDHGISYRQAELTKSQLYEPLEPRINSGDIELLDVPRLTEQLLGLVARGSKIDHLSGDHDDLANAAAGAFYLCENVGEMLPEHFLTSNTPEYQQQRAEWIDRRYDPMKAPDSGPVIIYPLPFTHTR